ncbi:MAG: hypothetical protein IJ364_00855 [Oscillospiraceae bacterium]|nr:hypothetical protein [Oscillospiraceae bacterium]
MTKSRNFLGLMALATIVLGLLKSKGIIAWDWIWVLSPVWIFFLIVNVKLVLLFIKEMKK